MTDTCPVCQSSDTQKKYIIKRFQSPFVMKLCNNCHCLFQSPMPENADQYYDAAYYDGTAEFSYTDERRRYRFAAYVYRARLKTILRYLPRELHGGRFLDVGCSFGGLTLTASRWFEAYGIDISRYAIEQGRAWLQEISPGCTVQLEHGSLTRLPANRVFTPENFAVITLIEVAEHLSNPRQAFAKAYELLQPGGMLVIQTANFAGWQAINAGAGYHYFLPGHLVCYTATALKNLLREQGFVSFKEFFPVDFSLWAKLCKSRGDFKKITDYQRWLTITWYHLKGKFFWRGRPLVSSYVLYAFKS